MSSSLLSVAFYGAGFMAQTHARVLVQIPEVRCIAVCASGDPSADAFAAEQGEGMQVFADYTEMLDTAKPDVVYICVPPFAHGNEVEQAAERGVHVFIEKPVALEVPVARRMVEAAEAAGIVTQVGFQMRFHPAVLALEERIASGAAGDPVLFTGRYWTNMDGKNWWKDRARSGGQILEQVIHLYDLAAHLMGEADLDRACGHLANVAHRDDPDYRMEDVSAGMLPHSSGGVSVITGCNAVRPMHFLADYRAVFAHDFLDYQTTGRPWEQADRAVLSSGETVVGEWNTAVDLSEAISADFLAAVREKSGARVPLRDGLRALEWVHAVQSRLL